ncbi:MAG: Os1348 family NHLP clan protein [Anaerolineae bacterium]|nr:Os1348 family NHLP clan protein [Anaerolineae bacterium]
MASRQELERVAGRALFDANFRRQLFEDPAGATQALRVELTEEQTRYIKELGAARLEGLLADLQKSIGPVPGFLW